MTSPRDKAKIRTLVVWFTENADHLHEESAEIVADRVGNEVLRVHEQLGVEVANEQEGQREIIVTAFSDPRLYPLVHEIVEALSGVKGWRFIALKPPRGFAFTLTVGEHRLDAKNLRFSPIPDVTGGFQLVPPLGLFSALPTGERAEELAWLIVETGVGEVLAGRVQHLEFAAVADECRPIDELEAFLAVL